MNKAHTDRKYESVSVPVALIRECATNYTGNLRSPRFTNITLGVCFLRNKV